MGTVTPRKLREATGEALREAMSATEVEQFCTGIGLAPPHPPDDVAFTSNRAYVVRRLGGKTHPELVQIALQVLDECDNGSAATELADLLALASGAGVAGEMKNLIFAADEMGELALELYTLPADDLAAAVQRRARTRSSPPVTWSEPLPTALPRSFPQATHPVPA
jgi:hypothetical protein